MMDIISGIILSAAGAGYIFSFWKASKAFGDVVRTQLEINDTIAGINDRTNREKRR